MAKMFSGQDGAGRGAKNIYGAGRGEVAKILTGRSGINCYGAQCCVGILVATVDS